MSWVMAPADGDVDGAMLGDAAVGDDGAVVGAPVGAAVGDAAPEQAAIASASAGTSKVMDRFMSDASLQGLDRGADLVRLGSRSI
jgi:hypothetical protein